MAETGSDCLACLDLAADDLPALADTCMAEISPLSGAGGLFPRRRHKGLRRRWLAALKWRPAPSTRQTAIIPMTVPLPAHRPESARFPCRCGSVISSSGGASWPALHPRQPGRPADLHARPRLRPWRHAAQHRRPAHYVAFLAAGTVCASTMNAATFEALYSAFAHACAEDLGRYPNTPLGLADVVAGELFWAATVAVLRRRHPHRHHRYGLTNGLLALWALPAIVLTGLAFAALGLIWERAGAELRFLHVPPRCHYANDPDFRRFLPDRPVARLAGRRRPVAAAAQGVALDPFAARRPGCQADALIHIIWRCRHRRCSLRHRLPPDPAPPAK